MEKVITKEEYLKNKRYEEFVSAVKEQIKKVYEEEVIDKENPHDELRTAFLLKYKEFKKNVFLIDSKKDLFSGEFIMVFYEAEDDFNTTFKVKVYEKSVYYIELRGESFVPDIEVCEIVNEDCFDFMSIKNFKNKVVEFLHEKDCGVKFIFDSKKDSIVLKIKDISTESIEITYEIEMNNGKDLYYDNIKEMLDYLKNII